MKKATVITYGCQMNVNESAKMKKIFENLGYEITENIRESDAIFLNTCTVREGAATQIYGKLGELMQIKATDSHPAVSCLKMYGSQDNSNKVPPTRSDSLKDTSAVPLPEFFPLSAWNKN